MTRKTCEHCDRILESKDFTTLTASGAPILHDFMVFCRPCATKLLTELMDDMDNPDDIEIIKHRPSS